MRMSTISKHSTHRHLASAIGHELHRRRGEAGLTQAALGAPLTRAFVCAVERGKTVPSIPALGILLQRLDIGFDEFFRGVQNEMTVMYTRPHGDRQEAPSCRRR